MCVFKMAAHFNLGEVLDEIFEETTSVDDSDNSNREAPNNFSVSADPYSKARRFLSTYPLHPASIFKEESMVWLKGIHRKLGGKQIAICRQHYLTLSFEKSLYLGLADLSALLKATERLL